MILLEGAAPQTPWDLALFFSRVDGLSFPVDRDCRTMEGLDRRIGQRRDATRAPNQPGVDGGLRAASWTRRHTI